MSFPVEFPAYMIDRRIIAAVRKDNVNYLKAKLAEDQYLFKRLYFYEMPSTTSSRSREVFCFPLMGYAVIYGSVKTLDLMLSLSVNPYQKGLIMEEKRTDKVDRKMQEINCISLLWMTIQSGLHKTCFQIFAMFLASDVDVAKTFDLRSQQTSNNKIIKHSLSVYGDVIHYLRHQFKEMTAADPRAFGEMNFYIDILEDMRKKKIDVGQAMNEDFAAKAAAPHDK